jgi:Bacterial SH3 domain
VRRIAVFCVSLLLVWSAAALGQSAVTSRPTNLRGDPSTRHAAIRLLDAGQPLTLLSSQKRNGYLHVETSDSTKGWAWARNIRIDTAAAAVPPHADSGALNSVTPGTAVPGTNSLAGCGDGLWQHVYHPYRLLVMNSCVTVSGTIVDASNGRYADGVKHEADGDTHGWLRLDPQFAKLLNNGNMTQEGGNLVFEIVCHYAATQADARPACSAFGDHTAIPAVGSHVAITGTFVQDTNHQRWNEIHPVSRISVIP